MDTKQIKIVDVTLREWDQAPLTSFNATEKSLIALMLSEMWVDVIEVGFWASRADFENIQKVSEIFWNRKTVISSLWRSLENDTVASLEALKNVANPRIHIFLAMSKEHIEWKFKKPWENLEETRKRLIVQAKTEIERARNWAIENNKSLEIEFSPEDATWNALTSPQPSPLIGEGAKSQKIFQLENNPDYDFLIKVCEEAIKSWANIINIPDTLWNLLPHQSYEFFKETSKRLEYLRPTHPDFWLSCHIHNDLAMATANAIESIRWWASYVESTLLGIGERAWNTSTSDIIWIIKEKWHNLIPWEKVELNKNFKYELIWPISDFVKNILWFDKYLQTPFIWALSDIDGSWVHNASADLYGWSKNKKQFGGDNLPEFFSPRWWANQIVNMLKKFNIEEDKKSEIIWKVTKKAALLSETVKALYWPNIYRIYLEETWNFEIVKLDIHNKKLYLEIKLNWKNIIFSWETEWKDWVIKTFTKLLNEYFGEEKVKVKDLIVKSKPSLKQEYEKFCNKLEKYNIKVNENFYNDAEKILQSSFEEDNCYSEAYAVNQVILDIDWKEFYSNSYDKNVTIGNIKAILEWVLFYI